MCNWGLRASWMAQEIMSTFAQEIGSVTLTPDRTGGVYDVHADGVLIFSRKAEGRFPDIKELKQLVRDHIAPGRSLGHSDEGAAATRIEQDPVAAAFCVAGVEGTAQPVGIEFNSPIPILRIFDVAKAYEFYRDFLGFAVDWEHRFGDDLPLYAQVSRAGLKLHLSEHHGDASPGTTVFIRMHGIVELHRELTGKAYRYNRPGLEDAPWDAKVLEAPIRSAIACASTSRSVPTIGRDEPRRLRL